MYLQTQLRSFVLCSDYSHILCENATAVRKLARNGVASKRSIAFLTRFIACYKKRRPTNRLFMPIAILDSLFYAYNAIVDCFVIVSFLAKHDISQYYR